MPDEQVERIMEAVFTGRKMQAIKLYRQATKASLLEAKNFIEALQLRLWQESPEKFAAPPGRSGCSTSAAMLLMAFAAAYVILHKLFG